MENKFEQMAGNSQSEHQVKQFKSKKQLKNYNTYLHILFTKVQK